MLQCVYVEFLCILYISLFIIYIVRYLTLLHFNFDSTVASRGVIKTDSLQWLGYAGQWAECNNSKSLLWRGTAVATYRRRPSCTSRCCCSWPRRTYNSHHITCTATEGYTLHNHVHNSHAGIDIVFPRTRALVDPHGLYESEGLYGRICPQSLRSWSGRLRPCPAGATVLRGKVKPKRKSCNWLARKRPRIIRFTLFSAPDPVWAGA